MAKCKCNGFTPMNISSVDCSDCRIFVTQQQVDDFCNQLTLLATNTSSPFTPDALIFPLELLEANLKQFNSKCLPYTFLVSSIANLITVIKIDQDNPKIVAVLLLQLVNALESVLSNLVLLGIYKCIDFSCITTALLTIMNNMALQIV